MEAGEMSTTILMISRWHGRNLFKNMISLISMLWHLVFLQLIHIKLMLSLT